MKPKHPDADKPTDHRTLQGLIALVVLAALPYLFGGAVWDDHTLIEGFLVHLDASGMLALWMQPVGGEGPGAGYYRPLAMTVLAVLGRVGIPAIHLLAAGLHMASSVMLYRLLDRRLAVLLFAVHPMIAEVLGWASALPDALAVFFSLLACTLLPRSAIAAGALLLAGVLCKETALLPFAFLMLGGRLPIRTAGWSLTAAAGLAFTARVMAGTGANYRIIEQRGLIPLALGWPISSSWFPWPMTGVRDLLAAPQWLVWIGVITLSIMLYVGRHSRLAIAGVGLLISAPLLALPPTVDGYLAAERYLYPGLVGLVMWASALSIRPALLWSVGLLSVGIHVWRAPQWHTDLALFTAATQAMPSSSYAWHFLGMVHAQEGRMEAAADAFGQAVETGHPHPSDRLYRLRALVESNQAETAWQWASNGPQDALTAEYIAWWARAAWNSGRSADARRLITMLRTPQGWDGPPWVGPLAQEIAGQ